MFEGERLGGINNRLNIDQVHIRKRDFPHIPKIVGFQLENKSFL